MTVTLPLVAPGLVATGVFAFIQAWNEFIFALVIMNRPENQTLPVWLQAFNEGAKGTDWGGVMAGSTLMAIPVIIFFLSSSAGWPAGSPRARSRADVDLDAGVDGCLLASFRGPEAPAWLLRRLERRARRRLPVRRATSSTARRSRTLTACLREAARRRRSIAIDEEGGDVTRLECDRQLATRATPRSAPSTTSR